MILWYTARGAGLAALVLLTVSTCLGVLASGRAPLNRRWLLQYVHRAAAGLGLAVVALHVGTILADEYANVGVLGAVVPFTSGYRPGWVALGTFAVYTFLAVGVAGAARGRMAATAIGARVWRGIHLLAYAGWGAAILHGINAGTDTGVTWVRALYVACGLAVFAAVVLRIGARNQEPARSSGSHRTFRNTVPEGVSR